MMPTRNGAPRQAERSKAIIARHAMLESNGRPSRCIVQAAAGRPVMKVIYPSLRAAQTAARELSQLPDLLPQFVYTCRKCQLYHHTTQPDAPNSPARPGSPNYVRPNLPAPFLTRPFRSRDHQRRYERKRGLAAFLLDVATVITFERLAEDLQWPLEKTPHGHEGRDVLHDLLLAFRNAGWIAYEDRSHLEVTDMEWLQVFVEWAPPHSRPGRA